MNLNRLFKHKTHFGFLAVVVVVLVVVCPPRLDAAFITNPLCFSRQRQNVEDSTSYFTTIRRMAPKGPAGSFFNPIPRNTSDVKKEDIYIPMPTVDIGNKNQQTIGQPSKVPLERTNPSLKGFKKTLVRTENGLIAIDTDKGRAIPQPRKPSLNDITKPLRDEQGYTLYADEVTGEKSRVFHALVSYPCEFTLKIVGLADNGLFVQDMIAAVAARCDVPVDQISHSTRAMGKWASLTVQAPVQNADMLYMLYDMLDQDPRVKFKF